MKVLIIEDEAKAVRELSTLLSYIDDDIQVIAALDSVEQALKWFSENDQPDLIFSDIQLADGICFDIYKQIQVHSPVIFCTAFDEYLMKAFDTNAISYLLKPITREKIEKALDKFHSLKLAFEKKQNVEKMNNLLQQLPYL